jgi:hypothetical protein
MIVTVSIVEMLSRAVKVKIPDDMPSEKAMEIVKEKYDSGKIVLDSDDFVSGSGEFNVAYTEDDSEAYGDPDYQLNEQGEEV